MQNFVKDMAKGKGQLFNNNSKECVAAARIRNTGCDERTSCERVYDRNQHRHEVRHTQYVQLHIQKDSHTAGAAGK